jgi:hypothetical protein
MSAVFLRWLPLVAAFACLGCAPQIGKHCGNSLDCSAQGSRICDRTQPGGYCTIMGCEQGTCPSESVCVKFRPQQERLAVTYCMATCEVGGDCRDDEGYRCRTAKDFGNRMDAETLGDPNQKFCAIGPPMAKPTATKSSGGTASRDASSSDGSDAAAP